MSASTAWLILSLLFVAVSILLAARSTSLINAIIPAAIAGAVLACGRVFIFETSGSAGSNLFFVYRNVLLFVSISAIAYSFKVVLKVVVKVVAKRSFLPAIDDIARNWYSTISRILATIVVLWLTWNLLIDDWNLYFLFSHSHAPVTLINRTLIHPLPYVIALSGLWLVLLLFQALVLARKAKIAIGRPPIPTQGQAAIEVALGPIEQLIQSTRFLATIAAAFSVTPFALFLITTGPKALVQELWPAGVVITLLFAVATGPFLLWSRALARRRVVQAMGFSVVVGSLIGAFGILQLYQINPETSFSRYPSLDLSSSGAAILSVVVIISVLITVTFGLRVITDGLNLVASWLDIARDNPRVSSLVTLERAANAPTFALAFGIHPICQWLPHRLRRLSVSALFVLATIALSCTIGGVIYVLFRAIPTSMQSSLVSKCYTITFEYGIERCFGDILWMLGYTACGLATFGGLRVLAHRLSRISLEQLVRVDQRAPVLFLRSFSDEQVRLARSSRPLWHRIFDVGDTANSLDAVLLEEATEIGPVIAIGMPGLPPPFGAARIYLEDLDWQAAVKEFAEKARAIVIVIDETPGVLWELLLIREAGHAAKTLFLLAPHISVSPKAAQIVEREMGPQELLGSKDGTRKHVVGWYLDKGANGVFSVLTTHDVSRLSYVSALRTTLGSIARG